MSENEASPSAQKTSNIISKFLGQEIAVLLLSGVTYLYAFFFERAYFKYFGVDGVYVSIELTDLLVAATAIIITLLLTTQLLWWLPARALKWFAAITVSNVSLVVSLVIFSINFSRSGRNWLTTAMLAVIMIMLFSEMYFVIRHWIKGGTYETYLDEMVKAEIKISEAKVDHHVAKIIGSSLWLAILFVLTFPAGFGTIAGNITASNKRTFLTIEQDTGLYALVGSYADGLVFTGVQEMGEANLKIPADASVIWISDNELSNVALHQRRVDEGLRTTEPTRR